MALTQLKTAAIADDAVTEDKLANAINTARAANTAKDLTALSASNLTSGTVPDARFPATLPAASAANLTAVPAANITGTLPAISAANLTSIPAANITGTLPAISATNLTNLPAANITGTLPAISGANLTNLPAANITGTLPAISGANLTDLPASGQVSNLIINGDMQVAQRGTSSTTNGYASLDRFRNVYSNVDENVTQSQVDVASGTTPYTLGFRKALKITNGNQTSGDNGDTNIQIWQRIESSFIANSGWNYVSSSSKVTLSFWVKSSVAQSFHCYLLNEDTTQHTFPFETGSLSADTWTKVTKTIPGSSNLVFNNDNGAGLRVAICPFLGSNKTANSLSNDTWVAYDGSNFTRDNTTTWLTTNDATFEVTGVLLELGDSASDYPHENYGDSIARCQRYYHSVSQAVWNNIVYQNHYFPTTMRANPTITSTSTGPNATRKNNWYGKKSSGGIEGGVSFDWTADAEL